MKRSSKQCMSVLWNLSESTRQRVESLQSKNHEDHVAGSGFTSMSHYNLVHTNANDSSDENPGCESSSGQGIEEDRDNSSMGFGKSQEQEGGYSGSTKRQKESPLCYTDGHMSPQ